MKKRCSIHKFVCVVPPVISPPLPRSPRAQPVLPSEGRISHLFTYCIADSLLQQVVQRHDFVEQRRNSLNKYLHRLAAHPIVGCSEEHCAPSCGTLQQLHLIPKQTMRRIQRRGCRCQVIFKVVRDGLVGSVPVKGGTDFFGMLSNIKQTLVNRWGGGGSVTGSRMLEEDEFLLKQAKVLDLAQQLTTISQQVWINAHL
ncbi:sorting nexin 2B-like protein [Carex littledalei]|uniref:Sorting nexin 2B-like protein n=1 Tax=Carex littledalei TaxID=544730 RepID=A0A833R059_9POAL|nr:sorting nexin 2B-like protein [Carex littledalei]